MTVAKEDQAGFARRAHLPIGLCTFFLYASALLGSLPSSVMAQLDDPVERGRTLIEDGAYREAIAAFREALQADPRNARALHGIALCEYATGRRRDAARMLRQAAEIAGESADAALTVNLAAVELELGQPMAAVRACVRHLERSDDTPDETVLNALGTALASAMAEHSGSEEFRAAGALYVRLNAKLEATRPGMKRWGAEWIPAEEYQADAMPVFPAAIAMVPLGRGPQQQAADPAAVARAPEVEPRGAATSGPAPAANSDDDSNDDSQAAAGIAVPIGPQLLLAPSDAVGDARQVLLESPQGSTVEARVLRTDKERRLALLKADGTRLAYFNLAEQCEAGAVECAAVVRPAVFNIAPEIVAGTTKSNGDRWTVHLDAAPRMAGSPVLQGGRIVGIAVGQRDMTADLVSVQEIRQWLGAHTPRQTSLPADPRRALYRVTPRD